MKAGVEFLFFSSFCCVTVKETGLLRNFREILEKYIFL